MAKEVDYLGTEILQHPNPLPHPHHRKIELQSPLDLGYLRENIAAAARQKLDLHLPPDAAAKPKTRGTEGEEEEEEEQGAEEEEDPMRARVAALVNQFLDRTFDLASLSVSVNGNDAVTYLPASHPRSTLPGTTIASSNSDAARSALQPSETITSSVVAAATARAPPEQESEREGIDFLYEDYDPRLSSKLAALYAELERETLAVSQLRRMAPAEGAKTLGEALLRCVEEEAVMDVGGPLPEGKQVEEPLELEPLPDGWSGEIGETYERGLRDLRRLGGVVSNVDAVDSLRSGSQRHTGSTSEGGGGSLMETVGKAQRARDVALELE